jgi:hypothetical protein
MRATLAKAAWMPAAPGLLALLGLLGLSACTYPDFRLVDQRTFHSTPDAAGPAELARSRLPPLPLVTIQFAQDGVDWHSIMSAAVEEARARKPDVAFDVLTALPSATDPAEQTRIVQANEADAKEVANALLYDGVNPDRIHLGLRRDPGASPREVRIYVR